MTLKDQYNSPELRVKCMIVKEYCMKYFKTVS
jgi:hypothetical protein